MTTQQPLLASFAMSRRFLHPDGGNDGGGGASPPAPAASTPEPTVQPQTPAAPAPRMYSEDQVNQIVQDRLARERRAAAATPAPEPQPRPSERQAPQPTNGTSSAALTAADVSRMVARESEFVRSVTAAGLNATQEGLLRTVFSASNVDNVSAWVTEQSRAFAPAAPATAQAAASTQSTNMPPKHVVPANGVTPAPVSTVPSDTPDNPLNWTEAQLNAYRQQHYPYPENPGDPRNAAPRRLLAIKTRAQAAHLLIPLDRVNR